MPSIDVVDLSRLQFALTAVRAVDARAVVADRHHGDGLRHDRPRDLARNDVFTHPSLT